MASVQDGNMNIEKMQITTLIDKNGRIVIPALMRKGIERDKHDVVLVTYEAGKITITNPNFKPEAETANETVTEDLHDYELINQKTKGE